MFFILFFLLSFPHTVISLFIPLSSEPFRRPQNRIVDVIAVRMAVFVNLDTMRIFFGTRIGKMCCFERLRVLSGEVER